MAGSLTQQIADKLEGLADIIAVFSSKKEILLKGSPKTDLGTRKHEISARLADFGLSIDIMSTDPYLLVRLRRAEEKAGIFPWLNVVLFLATGVTTVLTGALWEGVDWISDPFFIFKDPLAVIFGGLPFSLSLLAILIFHEFGHYFASRYHKVNVSLPYFIPAPPGIIPFGTFGAVIKSKSAFLNKKQLLDVGATGPLAGLAISIIVLIIGINNSTVQPMTDDITGIFFGESLLFNFISHLIQGPIGENEVLVINSVGLAGWVGLLVTMFNLIPVGQLDGGHIAYALFGRYQKTVAVGVFIGLAILSFYWPGWLLWLFIGFIFNPKHPPTVMDEIGLGPGRKIIGYICFAVFILCFIPEPIYINF
ncbi:MAG: site-2 protease family protein [Candidatus Zixiibacteriota bacterium]|nr:MAG: site-2 protease family protein [candidate division Zixibacteria bacterium]